MDYFSERYDFNNPLSKDVATLNLLLTGLTLGFDIYMLTHIMTNEAHLLPSEFSKKLIKWSGIHIKTKEIFLDALEDVLGWTNEHSMEVYNHGIKTLFLFRPGDFEKWNLTFEKYMWN